MQNSLTVSQKGYLYTCQRKFSEGPTNYLLNGYGTSLDGLELRRFLWANKTPELAERQAPMGAPGDTLEQIHPIAVSGQFEWRKEWSL